MAKKKKTADTDEQVKAQAEAQAEAQAQAETEAEAQAEAAENGNEITEADLKKIGDDVLKRYPFQKFLWIDANKRLLFTKDAPAGFVKVEKQN
jgi:hypothetical protein